MSRNQLLHAHGHPHTYNSIRKHLELQTVQEKIYDFLLSCVKTREPDKVLREFERIFLGALTGHGSQYVPDLYSVLSEKDEREYHHTLKRCCYILINNWEGVRKNQSYIQDLIALFQNFPITDFNNVSSKQKKIFYIWLKNFIQSQDYQELLLFSQRHDEHHQNAWIGRYTSYLLFEQSVNQNNPREQQEAARKLAKNLKDKFKFELAMYIARSQSSSSTINRYRNPTVLGDNVLRLIKAIVVKKGIFSYENIANIFLQQTQHQTLKSFKVSLEKYLVFSVQHPETVSALKQQLTEKLATWKPEYDNRKIDKDLILRVCNRVIDCLTTENSREPSQLFILLLSQGNSLTLVIVLLKLVLISRHSRSHLNLRIANLIRYYNQFPEHECQWVINFLEIFNITFAIYADNVEYNLIRMQGEIQPSLPFENEMNLDGYRVFSQLRKDMESTSG